MKIEVIVATVNLDSGKNLIEEMNITTDAIITNQTDKFNYEEIENGSAVAKIYSFNERGVGLNRNNGIMRSNADIVIIADDDIRYVDNYEKIVIEEFEKHKDADIILFNIKDESNDSERTNYKITKSKRVHKHNCLRYGAIRFAIKLESIKKKNIYFSLLFGGGARYGSGEDSVFIYNCIKSGLKVYSSNKVLLTIKSSTSTWFDGYNEKFFYDKGALFKCIFGKKSLITIPLFLVKHYKFTNKIGFLKSYKQMLKGYREF